MSVDSSPKTSPHTAPESKSKSPIAFTLVVPAYNEERRLPNSIRDIRAFFPQAPVGTPPQMEVLIVIEKSKDRTVELAREAADGDPRIHVIDNQVHRGKGFAVKSGMLKARGEIVFFMDADLSTPLAEVYAFLAHFMQTPETDVIIGSRAEAQSKVMKKQTWLRRNMGRSFNKFVKLFGVRGIQDTQCGFKAFRAVPTREVFSRQTLDGFAFDVEVLMLAQEMGYKIEILPVRWVNSEDSKVRIFIDPLKMLIDLLKTRWLVRRTLRLRPHTK
jgi:dolichyl-phosphate beta-glucosyltransferase